MQVLQTLVDQFFTFAKPEAVPVSTPTALTVQQVACVSGGLPRIGGLSIDIPDTLPTAD